MSGATLFLKLPRIFGITLPIGGRKVAVQINAVGIDAARGLAEQPVRV